MKENGFEFLVPKFKDYFEIDQQFIPHKIPEIKSICSLSEIFINDVFEEVYQWIKKTEFENYSVNLLVYSLLIALEKPLLPSTNGYLTKVLSFYLKKSEEIQKTEIEAMINSIIIVISEYFGQKIR